MKSPKPKSTELLEEPTNLRSDPVTPVTPTEVMDEETIKSYKINAQFFKSVALLKNRIPKPPEDKPIRKVKVRKVPAATVKNQEQKAQKKVFIAKPIKENEEEHVVLRSPPVSPIKRNTLKTYEILGTVEDFVCEASKQNHIVTLHSDNENEHQTKERSGTKNTQKDISKDEAHALVNWKKQMKERRKQQKHLSKQMMVDEDMLLINQSDDYRSIQEGRTIIDRAMPSKNYGKGYRIGSEFWKQVESIGGDDGISITLNQTEKGLAPPIEHIHRPTHIKSEMGTMWGQTKRVQSVHYPWERSSYLEERKSQLEDIIQELDPYQPDMEGLEVIGRAIQSELNGDVDDETMMENNKFDDIEHNASKEVVVTDNDPLSQFEDVIVQPIFGPCLLINGHTSCWEGTYNSMNESLEGLTIRLLFESSIGESSSSSVDMTNNGTTAVHYLWRKPSESDCFGLKRNKPIKRFYFNICNGIILPGETKTIPFFFKSLNAGIFKETWLLETRPVLLAGKKIEVILKGVATKEDDFAEERKLIEKNLLNRQNKQMIDRIVKDILLGIETPPRPSTPDSAYITEEAIFTNQNEKVKFSRDIVERLKSFYGENGTDQPSWDLSLNTLVKHALINPEEEERENLLEKLNTEVCSLYEQAAAGVDKNKYDSCYQIICEHLDTISFKSSKLRTFYCLPEKEFVVQQDASSKKLKKPIVEAQTRSRADSRGKKDRPGSPKRNTPMKEKAAKDKVDNTIVKPDSNDLLQVQPMVTVDVTDPAYNKYKQQFHLQVYNSIMDMAASIDTILSS